MRFINWATLLSTLMSGLFFFFIISSIPIWSSTGKNIFSFLLSLFLALLFFPLDPQNGFNLVELQRSLQPSPAQSVQCSHPQSITSQQQCVLPGQNSNPGTPGLEAQQEVQWDQQCCHRPVPGHPLLRRRRLWITWGSQNSQPLQPGLSSVSLWVSRAGTPKWHWLDWTVGLEAEASSQGSWAILQVGHRILLPRCKALWTAVKDIRGRCNTLGSQLQTDGNYRLHTDMQNWSLKKININQIVGFSRENIQCKKNGNASCEDKLTAQLEFMTQRESRCTVYFHSSLLHFYSILTGLQLLSNL